MRTGLITKSVCLQHSVVGCLTDVIILMILIRFLSRGRDRTMLRYLSLSTYENIEQLSQANHGVLLVSHHSKAPWIQKGFCF